MTITVGSSIATWPGTGFVRNKNSNEKMYYDSRTASTLHIPSTGRGIRGSSAASGSNGHVIEWMAPIDIGSEYPAVVNTIQTIPDENTAPTGLTDAFDYYDVTNPITIAGPLAVTDGNWGIWLKRYVNVQQAPGMLGWRVRVQW